MIDYFRAYKPNWLYKSLPYLYAVAGLLTILWLRSGVALFSGCLLIIAGGLVWYLRRSYRTAETVRSLESRQNPGLIDIVWSHSFNSGNKQIDDQHRALIADANVLLDEITNRESKGVINNTLRGLIRDIQTHFGAEEELLNKLAPGIAESHKAMHVKLLKEARHISDRVFEGTASMRELVGFVVYDVVTNHLAKEDTEFIPKVKGALRGKKI